MRQVAHQAKAYPGFLSMRKFALTHLYTWVERGTVRVKSLAQEHNTTSLARARTRTTRSGDEHINHEATTPPTEFVCFLKFQQFFERVYQFHCIN